MNLENQVCNLELSKRLFELGVKQDSCFLWNTHDDKEYFIFANSEISRKLTFKNKYSAFTASELLELLPTYINPSWLEIIKGRNLMELIVIIPFFLFVFYYMFGVINLYKDNSK